MIGELLIGEVLTGEVLKGEVRRESEVQKGKQQRMQTRPGRQRARSGYSEVNFEPREI